ncbi:hypothetical protein NSQ91_29510 [Paenibacillus sp. FSL R7-0048]|jgi:H+/Cl- antiporter ClcA|uniref:hypothetical protein n=1 Tax=Paenibacillus TaxID=44249 RepID=UPI00096D4A87|nr:hypothetical protein [Paenibacillus odorifer]HBS45733.1 hypothetical protein [Paenibacillus sp.]OMC64264.1 hypothetical protein BK121_25690 [Paenibacillus odorifer]OMD68474.1 hypothetical protein BSK62_02930 [Paenibacillus odorifer]OMD74672.1 hypothetical protein BSK48_02355 [Paenibacillus odorifer]OMD81326.1 hypothetical protein BSK50_00225 [Paenibacillus odorifer]
MELSLNSQFSTLSNIETMEISGGINWDNVAYGVLGMVTVVAAVTTAPVTIPTAIMAVGGSIVSGYLTGSGLKH